MKRHSVLVLAMIISVVVIGFWELVYAIILGSLGVGVTSWKLRRLKRCNKSAYMENTDYSTSS